MKCPYKKRIKVHPDGLGRITEVEFMDCDEEECPFWGIKTAVDEGIIYDGCRRAK